MAATETRDCANIRNCETIMIRLGASARASVWRRNARRRQVGLFREVAPRSHTQHAYRVIRFVGNNDHTRYTRVGFSLRFTCARPTRVESKRIVKNKTFLIGFADVFLHFRISRAVIEYFSLRALYRRN